MMSVVQTNKFPIYHPSTQVSAAQWRSPEEKSADTMPAKPANKMAPIDWSWK